MSYRSERFEPKDMPGLAQVWSAIDELDASGFPIVAEVMAGDSYRRRQNDTVPRLNRADYVIQATFDVPVRDDGKVITIDSYVESANRVLDSITLPTVVVCDQGGLAGLLPNSVNFAFGSTGKTEDDILHMYSPWRKARWYENGKRCLLFCGILPPQPKGFFDEHHSDWDISLMRRGNVVFEPTPEGLVSY